jgi:hypothetical protein
MDEHIYRDGVEFRSGARVRLQDLDEGQNVEVVALSSGYSDVVKEKLIPVRDAGSDCLGTSLFSGTALFFRRPV